MQSSCFSVPRFWLEGRFGACGSGLGSWTPCHRPRVLQLFFCIFSLWPWRLVSGPIRKCGRKCPMFSPSAVWGPCLQADCYPGEDRTWESCCPGPAESASMRLPLSAAPCREFAEPVIPASWFRPVPDTRSQAQQGLSDPAEPSVGECCWVCLQTDWFLES